MAAAAAAQRSGVEVEVTEAGTVVCAMKVLDQMVVVAAQMRAAGEAVVRTVVVVAVQRMAVAEAEALSMAEAAGVARKRAVVVAGAQKREAVAVAACYWEVVVWIWTATEERTIVASKVR